MISKQTKALRRELDKVWNLDQGGDMEAAYKALRGLQTKMISCTNDFLNTLESDYDSLLAILNEVSVLVEARRDHKTPKDLKLLGKDIYDTNARTREMLTSSFSKGWERERQEEYMDSLAYRVVKNSRKRKSGEI